MRGTLVTPPGTKEPSNRMAKSHNTVGLHRLIDAYVDGDARAFGRLHDRLAPRLKRLLVGLVRDASLADDLVQVTFLKAHLARDRFEVRRGDPDVAVQAWYSAIARNVGLDHLRDAARARERTSGADVDSVQDPHLAPEAAAIDREEAVEVIERVHAAIAALPVSQQEVIELHKLRGLSMAEIAEKLQIREGALRVRAHRAYRALAKALRSSTTAILLVMDLVGRM